MWQILDHRTVHEGESHWWWGKTQQNTHNPNQHVAEIPSDNFLPPSFTCSTQGPLPVFGTEDALVEPMLLALDSRVAFLAVSAKKPIEQEWWHQGSFSAGPATLWPPPQNTRPPITEPTYRIKWETMGYEVTGYSLGSKLLSLKAPSVCHAIATTQRTEEEKIKA